MTDKTSDATTSAAGGAEPSPKTLTPPALPHTLLTDEQVRQIIDTVRTLPGKEGENGLADAPFNEVRAPNKRAFLVALALCGRWGKAAQLAGLNFSTPYTQQWKEDTVLQKAIRVAEEMAVQIAEDEAYRRAVEGNVEPAGWYKGEPGGLVRRYSDVLLIFWLKGANPDKYKDRMEVRGTFGHINLDRVAQMPNGQDLLARLAAGESPFSVLGDGAKLALPAGNPEVGTKGDGRYPA